ncbi:AAA family ATPase [Paenibacillus soyae]|uniref:Nuclease SbcCD subunit C n=1 Tax=Paenibacillus soyae TaxID=2969249 RepID=A0A9X2MPD6_9BACL|nr:SMC family ATPase [Paenibacillus soyae]MCR2804371.1 SMC family ATPase [Paenibacillus soyae]
MRPLRLTMRAFGPYRDAETIDFMKLEDRRLFVISGNTGAGKTTIFDALCYALYGTASGEDRSDTRMLRSHFADDDTHTSVELEFAVGAKRYRIFRQMKHRKGNNRSETGEKSELYEWSGVGEVPAVDRFMTTEVNAKLLAIIGLTREQFSQIVMLPQGEFRKLLTSDTENKEEILRRIFRTELFEKLEGRFQARNRELQDRLRDARAGTAAVMKQAEEALPRREEGQLAETFRQEIYSASQVHGAVLAEAAYYEEQSAQAARRKERLSVELDEGHRQYREALEMNGKLDELTAKRAQLDRYAEQETVMREREHAIELAMKAARLLPYEEQALQAARQLEARRESLAKREAELHAALRFMEAAQAKHQEEADKEPLRREAEREVMRLTELSPIVATLDSRKQAADRLEKQERDATSRLADVMKQLEARRGERAAAQEELKGSEHAVRELPAKQEEMRSIEQKGKAVKRLVELAAELERHAGLERECGLAMERARSEYERLERAWLEGQAGMLAVHLVDGQPCPVCGSESHPSKAHESEAVPSKEMLQQSKETLAHVQSELLTARAQAAAATSSHASMLGELEDEELAICKDAEGEALVGRLQSHQATLRDRWKALKEQVDRLQAIAKRHDELREKQERGEKELEHLESERERLRSEEQKLMLERTAARASLEQELERIPEALRQPAALAASLSAARETYERMESHWKSAQSALQSAAAKQSEAKAYSEQAKEAVAEAVSQQAQAEERFIQELAKADFASKEAYKAALLGEAELDRLKTSVTSYRSEVAGLKERVAALQLELKSEERRDTEALSSALTALKEQYEASVASEGRFRGYMEEANRLANAIGQSAGAMAKLEAELEGVLDIYSMLKGDNALKMSFERYILIEYLEQILTMANERLAKLSNGQFRLERSDRLETRGKQSGLGLDVYDAYTGQNRDVKSLSGGEKFNASLCLALGMTDVIQAHQGGVSIEMMFIDEGFGSLDEESLHKAIAALVDLQRAGRMIGVISHVGELKEAFPACLEVTKTKEGFSTTAFVLK